MFLQSCRFLESFSTIDTLGFYFGRLGMCLLVSFIPYDICSWTYNHTCCKNTKCLPLELDLLMVSFVVSQTFLIVAGLPTNITNLEGLLVDLHLMLDKSRPAFKLSSALPTNQIIIFLFNFFLGLDIDIFRLVQW